MVIDPLLPIPTNPLKKPIILPNIRNVFEGMRYDLPPEDFPYVAIEPVLNNDMEIEMNHQKKIWFNVDVLVFVRNETEQDLLINGNDQVQGILDIENRIRAVLQSSHTLGGLVIDTQFDPTVFDYYSLFPIRACRIPVKFLYEQPEHSLI